jgi:hypothetical protein
MMPPGVPWPYMIEAGPLSNSMRSKWYGSREPLRELAGNLLPSRYSASVPVVLKPRTEIRVPALRVPPPSNLETPAVYSSAWSRESAAWAWICSRGTTLIDCAVSNSRVSVLVAVALRVATKPPTGPYAVSWIAAPVTVTVGSAAGVDTCALAVPAVAAVAATRRSAQLPLSVRTSSSPLPASAARAACSAV